MPAAFEVRLTVVFAHIVVIPDAWVIAFAVGLVTVTRKFGEDDEVHPLASVTLYVILEVPTAMPVIIPVAGVTVTFAGVEDNQA